MIVLRKTAAAGKLVVLNEFDLVQGFTCPECGMFYKPNGTGPQNKSWLSKLLKVLPSELAVGGLPARFHDCAYLLCPAGWTVSLYSESEIFAKDKKTSDAAYFNFAMKEHEDSKGLAKLLLWMAAKRNYLFVKLCGKSSYRHCHK